MKIIVENISKSYARNSIQALTEINLGVEAAEIFGLIGPDGSGKTSLFRILTTLLLPDHGRAWVDGLDIVQDFRSIRNLIGYMPGRFSLYLDLTVEENLNFFASVYNTSVEANYDLIRDIYVQIEPFKKRRAGQLSGGMKQKLALCCALIHRPSILFLDEPTTGVDVVSRREFWNMLKNLKNQGITIMVSTPYMDEANLCDRIALIQKGKLMGIDTPDNIVLQYPLPLYAVKSENMSLLLKDMRGSREVRNCFSFGEYLHVNFNPEFSGDAETHIRQKMINSGHQEFEMRLIKPTVEDCFIDLMGRA